MIQEILNNLQLLQINNDSGYQCFKTGCHFYGLDSENNVVFITSSQNKQSTSIQQTKQLVLTKNIDCKLKVGDRVETGRFDVLTCLSQNQEHIKAFIELTNLFVKNETSLTITDYFICLKDLFTNKHKISSKELQGIYAELYIMHYMYQHGVDLFSLWQSIDKMKFDFSVSEIKKIEVKSTIGENRIHKFRHEQLVTDIFDVYIISVLLRKDDQGLSLFDLANLIKNECSHNLKVFAHVENLLLNYSIEDLKTIKFNKLYTDKNIAIYKAGDVPRFKTRQPDGVSNTEYDSDLNNIKSRTVQEFIKWTNNN